MSSAIVNLGLARLGEAPIRFGPSTRLTFTTITLTRRRCTGEVPAARDDQAQEATIG